MQTIRKHRRSHLPSGVVTVCWIMDKLIIIIHNAAQAEKHIRWTGRENVHYGCQAEKQVNMQFLPEHHKQG